MKKITLGLIMIIAFAMFASFSTASAQADRAEVAPIIVSTGVRPVGFFDKVKLLFTFNKEKKANLLQDYSNREFELAKEKLEAGDAVAAVRYFQKSDNNTKKAVVSISKIENKEKLKEALASVSATATVRAVVLANVQANIEGATAKAAIGRVMEHTGELISTDEVNLEVKIKELENKNSPSTEVKQEVKISADSASDNKKQNEQKVENNTPASDWYEDNAWRAPPGGWNQKPVEETPIACDPTIKIISPNGGEVYNPGEQITIKWESTCAPFGFDIGLHFADGLDLNDPRGGFPVLAWTTPNDGIEVVTLPDETSFGEEREFGMHYKVLIAKHAFGIPNLPSDASDDLFTIEE